ncbi:MAG: tRNA pseudouridine(55) synthase TruB [Gemmatimonadota bacterium]|nr:tRNA pseudouridine(55) synthase TruB [Gemmatimonadota bacterium]
MDKPAGITSHDVVRLARRAYGTRAVGHTGTLDPFATGLLVLLLGAATRLARFVEAERKTYLATARLGWRTETDDLTGQPASPAADVTRLDPDAVRRALTGMIGAQRQRPPAYSAKRLAGERAYAMARRGEALELAEVPVTVYAVEPIEIRLPLVVFRTTVSAGTYIRALARDLGERLDVGGHLTALRREAIGALRVDDAVPADALHSGVPLLPPEAVLRRFPEVELDAEGRGHAVHGRVLRGPEELEGPALLMHDGRLVAVARAAAGRLHPEVVLERP